MLQLYGLTAAESQPVVEAFQKHPDAWIDFMMRFELGLEQPNHKQALISAATMTAAYVVASCIPLGPYLMFPVASTASTVSVGVTLIALTLFGYIKGRVTGMPPIRSALRTVLISGLAAAIAFGIARIIT